MYVAIPSLPTYSRPSKRRPSHPSNSNNDNNSSSDPPDGESNTPQSEACEPATRPRTRRTLVRPASRSSAGSGTPSKGSSSGSSAAGSATPTEYTTTTTTAQAGRLCEIKAGSDDEHDNDDRPNAASSTGRDPAPSSGSSHRRFTLADLPIIGPGSNPFFNSRSRTNSNPAQAQGQSRASASSHGQQKNVTMSYDPNVNKQSGSSKQSGGDPSSRASGAGLSQTESVSTTSVNTSASARTVTSTNPSDDNTVSGNQSVFVQRNGRTYLADQSLFYPLPCDLQEMHRQSLRTLLLIQVHGAPVASPQLITNPPMKVLEIGCGAGFWSMMCHRYFKARGHGGIEFTGVDIAPLAPGSTGSASDSVKPDPEMKWKFVQYDITKHTTWPFPSDEFDMVLSKDMSWVIGPDVHDHYTDEVVRILKPGGTYEVWETDHSIRMLRPHVPSATAKNQSAEEQEAASSLGAYIINLNTPLSAPLNPYLVEYNNWLGKALETREIVVNPCTLYNHHLTSEADRLTGLGSHRVAIPFSEVRWEREGVGGVVTKDGKSYVEMKGKGKEDWRAPHQKVEKKSLTAGQAALRRTALLTLVEKIQALEPVLREASGKSQDEWDVWMGKMTNDLMSENGTSWGECLETGAWWARKK